jgi:hypothetical protein
MAAKFIRCAITEQVNSLLTERVKTSLDIGREYARIHENKTRIAEMESGVVVERYLERKAKRAKH